MLNKNPTDEIPGTRMLMGEGSRASKRSEPIASPDPSVRAGISPSVESRMAGELISIDNVLLDRGRS